MEFWFVTEEEEEGGIASMETIIENNRGKKKSEEAKSSNNGDFALIPYQKCKQRSVWKKKEIRENREKGRS